MGGYLYLAVLTVILGYTIIHDILMYKSGSYYPYIIKHGKGEIPLLARIGSALIIYIGAVAFGKELKILHGMLYIFMGYTICLIFNTGALNYLSYKRSHDRKIVLQTILLDIFLICAAAGVWNFVFS